MILPQYQATASTYGVRQPPAPSPYARPTTTLAAGAYNPNAPRTTAIAGASGGGIVASGSRTPMPTTVAPQPSAPAPSATQRAQATATAQSTQSAANAAQATEQQRLQSEMDARSQQNSQLAMAQEQSMARPQPDQGGGYGGGGSAYGAYQPTPIPIAEGPAAAPVAAAGSDTQGAIPPGGMRAAGPAPPDVGGGWGEFGARPTGPQNLGLSRASAPMQALRAMRAGGGLY